MDTLKHEEIEELREHQPIPHGGWKLVGGIMAAICALSPMLGAVTLIMRGESIPDGDFVRGGILILGAFECIALFFWGCFAISDNWNWWPFPWLHAYWSRNVRGYVARFVFVDKPVSDALGKWPRLRHDIRTRKGDADDRWQTHRVHAPLGESNVAISLPLGGWFAQSWIRGIDRDQIRRLQGWSVRLRAILNTGAVMVEIRKHNRFWGTDECIVTDVGSALRYLEEIATKPGTPASISDYFHWKALSLDVTTREREKERKEFSQSMDALFRALDAATGQAAPPTGGNLTDWLVEQVRRLVSERDAARGEVDRYQNGFLPAAVKDRDAARQEREDAVVFITELDRRFEESSRLHDKLQALRIHERIREWLYFHRFPTAWETAIANVNQQHDADAVALADVRKLIEKHEQRDRRQHGRRSKQPNAPAGA